MRRSVSYARIHAKQQRHPKHTTICCIRMCVCVCGVAFFGLKFAYIYAFSARLANNTRAKNYRLLVPICMHYNLKWGFQSAMMTAAAAAAATANDRVHCLLRAQKREIEFYYDIMIIIIIFTDYTLSLARSANRPPISNHVHCTHTHTCSHSNRVTHFLMCTKMHTHINADRINWFAN